MTRQPAVSDQFYPGQKEKLAAMLKSLIPLRDSKLKAVGIVCPHAGYIYSGAIAGETFGQVLIPDKIVVLGPNHHGIGHPAAVFPGGSWKTPLGEARVDEDLATRILDNCPQLAADTAAHRFEHSLEVQVPFIQFLNPAASIVPICLGFNSLDTLLHLGGALGRTLLDSSEGVLIVASTDMSHYESGESAREKDGRALERMLALDPSGLFRTVKDGKISMCGMMPVVALLSAAKEMGARSASLVRYGNSGDVTGDQSQVVGYAGAVIR